MIPGAGPMESGFSLSTPCPPSDHSVEPGAEAQSLSSLPLGALAQSCVPECSPVISTKGRGYVSSVSTHSCPDFRVHACLKSGAP